MKKIAIILGIFLFASPAFAACSITGEACTLSDKEYDIYASEQPPEDLYSIGKSKGNTTGVLIEAPTGGASSYNSNCQFGVCLPSAIPDAIMMSDE